MATTTTTWGLIVEETHGFKDKFWRPEIIGHVEGTREQAMKILRDQAQGYKPTHPASPQRRLLYQDTDGFLLVVEGVTQNFHCRFTLAALIHDSAKK